MIRARIAIASGKLPKMIGTCFFAILLPYFVAGCTRQPSAESADPSASSETRAPESNVSHSDEKGESSEDEMMFVGDNQSISTPDSPATNDQNRAAETQPNQAVSPPMDMPQSVTSRTNGQRKQLARDLKPEQLLTFLSEADIEMRMIVKGQSGIEDNATAFNELKRIATLKREASRRLIEHADANEKQKSVGRRGELQSLSHLASLGDLRAAESLQTLAETLQEDSDPEVRSDSQLVLIGFAIEDLRNGKSDAPTRVVSQIDRLLQSSSSPDAAALMVMGQAKDALLQFEHVEEASRVRAMILEEFVEPAESNAGESGSLAGLTDMARQIAGPSLQVSEATTRVQQLMQQFIAEANVIAEANENTDPSESAVSTSDWKAAIETLANEQPDLLTTQFLAGASLEAETVGREDLSAATYQVLDDQFASLQDDRGREARTALQARENREKIVGKTFDPDLPSTKGDELSLKAYRGKVVLMPFWSAAFPDSLLVVDNLQQIAKRYPEKVAIVGMNLDVESTDVPAFESRNQINFPSFRSVSDPEASVANSMAYRFGVVSLLFVAVIDQDGQVAAIEFSGRDLTPLVENLLQ